MPSTPSAPVITVDDVSKVYQIYDHPQDRLKQAFFRNRRYFHEFWALRGVSLEVRHGETVGIIGRNGSGKSTLLQIICGTLQPSAGQVAVQGRVSALLELGSGFNPDFTGRENVYLNASILGLGKAEIDEIYHDIVDFAEIGDHLNQPIKTYSSGMVVRLAFAVAISVNPDILVVDEALAVGDEAFQRRCMARIDAIREAGATVLFVSHSSTHIISLCDRVILLDRGEKLFEGKPRLGINCYHKLLYMPADKTAGFRDALKAGQAIAALSAEAAAEADPDSAAETAAETVAALAADGDLPYYDPALTPKSTVAFESRGALIDSVRITTEDGRRVNMLTRDGVFVIRARIRFLKEAHAVATGTLVKTLQGIEISAGSTYGTDDIVAHIPAGTTLDVAHRFTCRLTHGTYFLNCGVSGIIDGERHWLHRITDAAMFQVIPGAAGHSKGPFDLCFQTTLRPAGSGAASDAAPVPAGLA